MNGGHLACPASNNIRKSQEIFSLLLCSDGIAGRYPRPLRTGMRAGRMGCVQERAEGGGRRGTFFCIKSRVTD